MKLKCVTSVFFVFLNLEHFKEPTTIVQCKLNHLTQNLCKNETHIAMQENNSFPF